MDVEKKIGLLVGVLLSGTMLGGCVAPAPQSTQGPDELHNKAMAATHDLQRAIDEMRVMQEEHGPEFGGHMAHAEQLAQQAMQEREEALRYYRARHPGWQ